MLPPLVKMSKKKRKGERFKAKGMLFNKAFP